MSIRVRWDRGELGDEVEGEIVQSDVPWAAVGDAIIVEFHQAFEDDRRDPPVVGRGPVLRFPNQGNTLHHVRDVVVEDGEPAHLRVTLLEE